MFPLMPSTPATPNDTSPAGMNAATVPRRTRVMSVNDENAEHPTTCAGVATFRASLKNNVGSHPIVGKRTIRSVASGERPAKAMAHASTAAVLESDERL